MIDPFKGIIMVAILRSLLVRCSGKDGHSKMFKMIYVFRIQINGLYDEAINYGKKHYYSKILNLPIWRICMHGCL